MRKRMLTALTTIAAGALVASCGSPASDAAVSKHGSDEAIKIALVPATSGALAQLGTAAVQGWQLAADEANSKGGIGGRKVELIIKASDGSPPATLRAAQEAVTNDGARFISGVITSPENAALNAQLEQMNALSINTLGKDDALIGKNCASNAFHISHTPTMDINTLARVLPTMPGKKWAIQAMDYGTGHRAAATFEKAVKAAGKEVVVTQFAPLGTSDFGPYISKIQQSGADAVFAVEFGSDGINFVKQAAQFDLDQKVSTVLGMSMIDESTFPVLGEAVLGYYNNVAYHVDARNNLNRTFADRYTKKFGSAPFFVPADSYLGAQLLFAAIEKADSVDPTAVREALAGLTTDTIVGKVTVRADDHQLMRPGFVGQVVKEEAGMRFKIIAESSAEENIPPPNSDCKI
jgi:ABC-type branched-subunit amino acid transport system substrate-binding protein